ncbi:MAG: hypothetical protein F4X97_04500 [Boseongicola sp. SB0662_bin_57]|nr:hypothetical protein [Boseongicola sp. SB0662_bin_57]
MGDLDAARSQTDPAGLVPDEVRESLDHGGAPLCRASLVPAPPFRDVGVSEGPRKPVPDTNP